MLLLVENLRSSSIEVEYRSLKTTTSEIMWLQQLLKDLRLNVLSPSLLFCDNEVAIHIATNPIFHERTKYIELDSHFVCDHVSQGTFAYPVLTAAY